MNTESSAVQAGVEPQPVETVRAPVSDRDLPGTVEAHWTQPRVHTDPDSVAAVTDPFGVVSARPAIRVDRSLSAIESRPADVAAEGLDRGPFRGGSTAPTASRPEPRAPKSSCGRGSEWRP